MTRKDSHIVVGWREWVSLPDWKIKRIRAKIDTGARTCAIHVSRIEFIDEGRVRFELVVRERPNRKTRWMQADLVRNASVKPMAGVVEQRPVVRTRMRIGDVEREIEIGLVAREGMLCRMLVGRTALGAGVVVDPSSKYLLTRLPPRERGIKGIDPVEPAVVEE